MSESVIFKAAVKLAPERRAAYLDQTCGANPDLRREVESLLLAHDASGSFLQDPPARPLATVDDSPITEGPGTVIGPYKLLQQIGEGGMGVVYMSEQQEPVRRKVALKIIKPGMDSRQVIARFEAERQALAMMDHQNIAKVLGAGATDTGRPYFVMELVHGISLTKYCDDNKLTPRQRLELFVPVCQAIQHAHQKGIIHRDVKPSNVLVTMYDDKPVPKVIDFGVAKAVEQRLTEKTLFTQYGTLVGTFEYMSPEQAEMNAFGVDTRSDIYSLGVLLYELLTGSTPLERQRLREAAYGEIVRLIREEDPPRPSTRLSSSGAALAGISQQRGSEPDKLTRLVRGELDWIVMRCLEKDRTRRYETANGLVRDVERYLKDEPVEACPPTTGYRLRKFARKNRKLLATAAAFAALLLLGVVASGWQAVRATEAEAAANGNAVQAQEKEQEANQQRDEAQKQRDEVKALNEKLLATQAQLRSTLYAAHLNLAQHAWDAGGVERVRELLEQQRPKKDDSDLRGFEWHYLHRLSHAERLVLKGHTHIALSVAYSPDGKRLASCNNKGEFKVWDAQTGQELLTFRGHSDYTQRIVFSPDGQRLASVSFDKTVIVWDAQTGKELITLKGHTRFALGVAFSPDGKRLASSSIHHVQGKRIGEVKVWDTQTGKELLTLDSAAFSVAFSPDGNYLAGGSKVWDAQTGRELFTLKGAASCVVFSPDSKRLATSCGVNNVEVWDAKTGKELLTIKAHPQEVAGVAFSPDGKRLASASEDRTVKVWDAQTGQELYSLKGHTGGVTSVAFSPDGKHLATAGDVTLRIWDTPVSQNPLVLKQEAGLVACLAFSPDGKHLASGSPNKSGKGPGILKVWDTRTGQELFSLKGHTNSITDVAFSPDGKRIASASYADGKDEGEVKVWEAAAGKELLTLKAGLSSAAEHVAFSPDGKHLASIGRGILKMWDVENGKGVFTVKGVFGKLAFSPEGKCLASPSRVWDAQTGKELLTFKGSTTVAISPDGKRLATGGDDNELKIWDAQTGQELLTLRGHTSEVGRVTFSPDGKRLASVASDKTVKVWDAQTGQELLTIQGHGGNANGLAFSPDGHRLAAGAADGTVRIWDATSLREKR